MNFSMIIDKATAKEYDTQIPYKCDAPYYPDNHVFDENKTVAWNKQELVKSRELISEHRNLYRKDADRLHRQFICDLHQAISTELDSCDDVTGKILDRAWQHSHSSGYESVVYEAQDLVNFIHSLGVI